MKFFKAVLLAIGRTIHRISPRFSKKLEPGYPFARREPGRLAAFATKTPRVALLSSAGLYLENQQPFQYKNFYGDFSFRIFPADFPLSSLRLTESDFDRSRFEADPGSLFPLAELKTVAAEFGGGAAAHHFSLLGFCLKPKKLLETSIPLILKTLKEDGTNLVFLVPACVVCHEVLPQVASKLEEAGVATVTFAFIERALEAAKGPRTILFGGDCGLPFGASAVETRKELLQLAIRAAFEMKTAGEVWRFPPPASKEKSARNAAAVR
ncbi:MAG TPA: hypothetical protein VNL73_01870 [Verrucomicrobiae bacterium]|nr:hypothetical protein [Verrucomicrobiae bacterium]